LFREKNNLANWDLLNGSGDLFFDSIVLEFEIRNGCGVMLVPKPTPGNPLLLKRSFGVVGSVGAFVFRTERDAELILTTGSMTSCLPITV
jgi:hypothetical protein